MRLVDLSHVIDHQMVTYPGLPGPEISEHLSFEQSHDHYAAGTEFAIGRISMVANASTRAGAVPPVVRRRTIAEWVLR